MSPLMNLSKTNSTEMKLCHILFVKDPRLGDERGKKCEMVSHVILQELSGWLDSLKLLVSVIK